MNNKEKYFKFLDVLKNRGSYTTLDIAQYLLEAFNLTTEETINIMNEWLDNMEKNIDKACGL